MYLFLQVSQSTEQTSSKPQDTTLNNSKRTFFLSSCDLTSSHFSYYVYTTPKESFLFQVSDLGMRHNGAVMDL